MVSVDFVKDLVRLRHRKSLSNFLRQAREKSLHVTDFVYGCPRYTKWVYKVRMESDEDNRNLSERDMTVFVIGKKLDEIPVGDYHHVKLRSIIEGVELVGEIDDLILDLEKKFAVVIDKKHIRGKPPREAHDHYIRQVNMYCLLLKIGKVESCEGDIERLKVEVQKLDGVKMYGAILYIDVTVESNQISDVVSWQVSEETLDSTYNSLKNMIKEYKKDLPAANLSWFCGYCPFVRPCADAGVGNGK